MCWNRRPAGGLILDVHAGSRLHGTLCGTGGADMTDVRRGVYVTLHVDASYNVS